MFDGLLSTKLAPPILRKDLVARPRLVSRLNAGLREGESFVRKLTLVSAPAGFGKTTAVIEWLRSLRADATRGAGSRGLPVQGEGIKVAWVSLEDPDNDPTRFLKYLLASVRQIHDRFGETTEGAIPVRRSVRLDAILPLLVNELAAVPGLSALTLDDYHAIHTAEIHQFISSLLEHLPAHVHLVIVTREDPLLPIARLRAGRQMLELRQDDLRFTPGETTAFLQSVMGLSVSAEGAAALEQRTEGWIAGLQLAALSLRGQENIPAAIQALAGNSRFILDYLVEEVFERQSPEVKDFLLKTSILERLSAPLCDTVTERSDSHALLESLEQGNLFIMPLDLSRTWYRYHRLFAELLRHRLRLSGLDERQLNQRASRWYAGREYFGEAIQHAIEAEDWQSTASLIGRVAEGMLKHGEMMTLTGWCGRIPEEVILSQPSLGMAYAWALLLVDQFDRAASLLKVYERIGQSAPVLLGQVATAQAYLARERGDNARVIERSQLALRLLPESELVSRSNLLMNLGLVYWHAGLLGEAEEVLAQAEETAQKCANEHAQLSSAIFRARTLASRGLIREAEGMLRWIVREGGQHPILALAHYDLAAIHYEWNELAEAGESLERSLQISQRSGNVEFQNAGHMLRASLALAQDQAEQALEELQISHNLARQFNAATRARSAACHAQIALRMGDLQSAEHWCRQAEDVDAHPFYRFCGLMTPRLLLAQGRNREATQALASCAERATQHDWGYALHAIRALQAVASGERESLANAIKLARPEGYIRTFAEAGKGLIPLLQDVRRSRVESIYVSEILAAMGEKPGMNGRESLIEPLSEREVEVLRLITSGLSNREIAEKLVISAGTVKTHFHHLCGKLGVRNRTEAAMKARELGLV